MPIGERPVALGADEPGTEASPPAPGKQQLGDAEVESVPPKGSPFVLLDVLGSSVPGLIVEQRRTERGWRVLLALVEAEADHTRSVSVRWVDADRVRPATGG